MSLCTPNPCHTEKSNGDLGQEPHTLLTIATTLPLPSLFANDQNGIG